MLTDKAVQVIRHASAAAQPFFVYVLPYTPHSPSVAAARGHVRRRQAARPPAFDEADVNDKAAFIRMIPPLDDEQIDRLEREYQGRLRSLQAIDDMVASIVEALQAAQVLENTYVIYSSDNGFHLGQHRLPAGKDFPMRRISGCWRSCARPGVPAGRPGHAPEQRLRSDLRPDRRDRAPEFVDGRSFLPLFEDAEQPWRKAS